MLDTSLSVAAIAIAGAALVLSWLSYKRTDQLRAEEKKYKAAKLYTEISNELASLSRKNSKLQNGQIALHAARNTYHSGSRIKDEADRQKINERLDRIREFGKGLAQKTKTIKAQELTNHLADLDTVLSMLQDVREAIEDDETELEARKFEFNSGTRQ